jgi:flagella basal body P-ring formation protein FlgA
MESQNTTDQKVEEENKEQTQVQTPPVRPEYTGDKGEFVGHLLRDTFVEKKTVATFSYGQRVRIASLYTPKWEDMLDHII